MPLSPEEGHRWASLPRLKHWLVAAATLFAVTLAVPVLAGLV
jgi:hypothetical protein